MNYKLDKTKFKAQTAEEASGYAQYYKTLTWKERFKIAKYLNSIAYKLVNEQEPKINKTVFSVRSRGNG